MPNDITKPTLLFTEGVEDQRFFKALIEHLGLENIQVETMGGVTKLPNILKTLKDRPGFFDILTSIGIIRDADVSPEDTFRSIRFALERAGLPVPRVPLETVGEKPRVTLMILPAGDTKTPGMLEDLCLQSSAGEPALPCVEAYFECLQQQGLSLPTEMSKAKIQVYLASRKPELRLGEAAEKGYWPWHDRVFNPMKSFLQQIAE